MGGYIPKQTLAVIQKTFFQLPPQTAAYHVESHVLTHFRPC